MVRPCLRARYPDAPAESDPADPDRPRVPESGGHAVGSGGDGVLGRRGSRRRPRGAALGVDLELLHAEQVEDDAAVGHAVPGHAVATAPDRQIEPGLGGQGHDACDVVGRGRHADDDGRPLVEAPVERPWPGRSRRPSRTDDPAGDHPSKVGDRRQCASAVGAHGGPLASEVSALPLRPASIRRLPVCIFLVTGVGCDRGGASAGRETSPGSQAPSEDGRRGQASPGGARRRRCLRSPSVLAAGLGRQPPLKLSPSSAQRPWNVEFMGPYVTEISTSSPSTSHRYGRGAGAMLEYTVDGKVSVSVS